MTLLTLEAHQPWLISHMPTSCSLQSTSPIPAFFLYCHTPACLVPIYQASSTLGLPILLNGGDIAGSSLLRCSKQQQRYHNMGFFSIILLSQQPRTSFASLYKNPTLWQESCSWISFFFSPATCHWNTADRGDMSHGSRIAERGDYCITEIRQMNWWDTSL